jgi:hypothetical protein
MRARVVYRSLLLRGLAPAEAANVAAFLAGLRCSGVRWTLPQVEALVDLRERWSATRGPDDGPVRQLTWSRS